MNIYKVERTDVSNYDEFDSFVCYAESELDARNTHPSGKQERWEDRSLYNVWPIDRHKDLIVVYLGQTKAPVIPQVICSSFNAG